MKFSNTLDILLEFPPEVVLVLVIAVCFNTIRTSRRVFMKTLRRSPPVIVLVLIFVVLDSLTTWGHDLEKVVFDIIPLLYLALVNIRILNYRLDNLRVTAKYVWFFIKWCMITDISIDAGILIFSIISTTLLMPALDRNEHNESPSSNETYTLKYHPIRMVDSTITEETSRYLGEDIQFRCKLSHDIKPFQVVWILDGAAVIETSRHKISSTTTPDDKHVISNLSIVLLDENEFGNYSCWILYFDKLLRQRYSLAEVFILSQRHEIKTELTLPPLGVFNAQATYVSSLEEDEDMMFVHHVDGEPVICEDDDVSYIMYYHRAWNKRQMTVNDGVQQRLVEGLTAFYSMTCMCPLAFGVHSFSVIRPFYNSSSSKWNLVESTFPKKFNILPTSFPFMAYFNVSKSSSYDNIPKSFFKEYSFMFHIIEIIVVVMYWSVCFFMTNKMFDIILLPIISFITNTLIHYAPDLLFKLLKDPIEYNTPIYIACEETDSPRCEEFLKDVFGSVICDVFIPLRDTHPGQSELEGIREGMDKCSRYLIVLAKNEDVSSPMWKHQVEVILDRLVRGEVSANNIRILRINHAFNSDLEEMFRVKGISSIHFYREMSPTKLFWAMGMLQYFAEYVCTHQSK